VTEGTIATDGPQRVVGLRLETVYRSAEPPAMLGPSLFAVTVLLSGQLTERPPGVHVAAGGGGRL
jgi:hypothetical protein